MTDDRERDILASWHRNAAPWTEAVRRGEIESRRLVTDRAVLEAVTRCAPRSVLDVGCGEGWLTRALAARGMEVLGVDGVADLIEAAERQGGAAYRLVSYREIAAGALEAGPFDLAVCNFSLLGETSVEELLRALPTCLVPSGRLVIQTLHPVVAGSGAPYRDGWREGSWTGFSQAFHDPAPWYFRTVGSWIALLRRAGFELLELREPLHPGSLQPLSILFVARCRPT